jgi:hypothetical protein
LAHNSYRTFIYFLERQKLYWYWYRTFFRNGRTVVIYLHHFIPTRVPYYPLTLSPHIPPRVPFPPSKAKLPRVFLRIFSHQNRFSVSRLFSGASFINAHYVSITAFLNFSHLATCPSFLFFQPHFINSKINTFSHLQFQFSFSKFCIWSYSNHNHNIQQWWNLKRLSLI